ncbi:MAG: hypothetical protein PHD81_03395 [Candidatus Nanoarchaeia archaeon]|nr:hypothetical protein [Candidatus Nanoarchaeia archaeon]MDD5588130.1 hypothetical protein [Candidatus Nanoarchaeia archaeon]
MVKEEGFKRFWNRLKNDKLYSIKVAIITLIIVLIILSIIYFFVPKNCNYNEECFNKVLEKCGRAQVFKVIDFNTYLYEVKGTYKGNCLLNIKVMELAGVQEEIVKEKLENRGMLCKIPKDKLQTIDLTNLDILLDYCTGPLKEGLLEIIIQKFYEQVVTNIGPISAEMQKQLLNKTF